MEYSEKLRNSREKFKTQAKNSKTQAKNSRLVQVHLVYLPNLGRIKKPVLGSLALGKYLIESESFPDFMFCLLSLASSAATGSF